jgi:hypothetical protein
MTWTDPSAGQTLTAAKLAELATYSVRIEASKASDSPALTSDATLNADPDLVIVLPANRTYDVDGWMIHSSAANAAGDIQFGWSWTNTATVTMYGLGPHNSMASGSQSDLESIARAADTASPTAGTPYGASTTSTNTHLRARVVTDASAVTLTLNWAQATSNASGTTLHAGSYISARRANV